MAEYKIKDTTLTGIADAIRGKTGGTDAIMVSAMAEAIAAIETGGGGGGTPIVKTGSFTASAAIQTVTHGLGVVPFVFYVSVSNNSNADKVADGQLYNAFGLSERASAYGAQGGVLYTRNSDSFGVFPFTALGEDRCLESTSNYCELSNATETSIVIGCNNWELATGAVYAWIAIGFAEASE